LNVHGFGGYARGKPVPTLLQVLDGKPPANSPPIRIERQPGIEFQYSGGGFCIVQQLIQDVTRMPFAEAMRALVLDPIEMKASTYEQPIPTSLAAKAAHAHGTGGTVIAGQWHTYPERAAAGLWTTPADLARFATELGQAAAGKSERVLSMKTAEAMLTRQVGGWGLGVSLGPKTFAHNGSNAGFQCLMIFHPESSDGAVVMTNGDRGGALAGEIQKSIAKAYSWRA
jgi:CubicO group peptidase (beta-lactamase class C family)